MAKRKKVEWKTGDVFIIPLRDKSFAVGQVLGLQMINVVGIALFDERLKNITEINMDDLCKSENLISLVAVSKEQLDYDVWKILGNKEILIPNRNFPNEEFRNNGWIGASIYDAAILEDFINAFYGQVPWDDWADPFYLDKFLYDKSKKPTNLVLIKK